MNEYVLKVRVWPLGGAERVELYTVHAHGKKEAKKLFHHDVQDDPEYWEYEILAIFKEVNQWSF